MITPEAQGSREQFPTKEYTLDDISNLFFWSFAPSQGSGNLHSSVFITLLTENPALIPAVQKLKDTIGSDRTSWLSHPYVAALVERIHAKRGSRSHSSSTVPYPREGSEKEVVDRLGSLFEALESVPQYLSHAGADPLFAFIGNTIKREVALNEQVARNEKQGLPERRALVGGSFLCWYGLSPNREEHLRGTKDVPPLPKEIQALWRKAGDALRARHGELWEETTEELRSIISAYERQTGERIDLA